MSILSTMSKRTYKKVTTEEVIALYNQGLNFSQIAEALGCVRNTIRNKIRLHVEQTGLPIPTRTKPGLGFRDITQVLEWYKDGKKVTDIAEHYRVTTSCIYKILQKYGG